MPAFPPANGRSIRQKLKNVPADAVGEKAARPAGGDMQRRMRHTRQQIPLPDAVQVLPDGFVPADPNVVRVLHILEKQDAFTRQDLLKSGAACGAVPVGQMPPALFVHPGQLDGKGAVRAGDEIDLPPFNPRWSAMQGCQLGQNLCPHHRVVQGEGNQPLESRSVLFIREDGVDRFTV